jgi:hypothetical protein
MLHHPDVSRLGHRVASSIQFRPSARAATSQKALAESDPYLVMLDRPHPTMPRARFLQIAARHYVAVASAAMVDAQPGTSFSTVWKKSPTATDQPISSVPRFGATAVTNEPAA